MYDNTPDEALRLSRSSVVVGMDGGEEHIGVVSGGGTWSVSGVPEWVSVSPTSGGAGTSVVSIVFDPYIIEQPEEPEEPENPEEPEEPEQPEHPEEPEQPEESPTRQTSDPQPRTAVLTFSGSGVVKELTLTQLPTPVGPGRRDPEYGINEAIHSEYLDRFYYNGETQTAPADYNQSYRHFWNNYLQNLKRNELDGGEWSRGRHKYLHSYIEKNPIDGPHRLNYGMEFDLGNYDGKLVGRILYVDPDGPADRAGLKRGDWFWKVNGVQMRDYEINNLRDSALVYKYHYNRLIDTLVHPLEDFAPELGMLRYEMHAGRLVDDGVKVSIFPERFEGSPVVHSSTIVERDVYGEQVRAGYLVLNRFEDEEAIVAAFAGFEDLTHFVLDLRYNRSGRVEIAELVGNLLVPEAARGVKFSDYAFHEEGGRSSVFEPDPRGVAVDSIFVLTGPRTAGGSELLINALRGIPEDVLKLVVVGDTTLGLSVGMVSEVYRTTSWSYEMYIASARVANALGEGDYRYGLVPNGGTVSEWSGAGVRWSQTWGWKELAGQTQDPLLARAMEFVLGSTRMPVGRVLDASTRQRAGLPREFEYPNNMILSDE